MAQAKLILRPPPNVDFVQGYPGIPPGAPDRPQAAVKGAIEVRMGPSGVKAKYVRIELRKIETLPGGQQNAFYDYVGQSPINLWQSSEEYGVLTTQDIPFYIRIPESIPPSLALEKGAGVRYELVGQVCIQGKTGFFRRNKSIILQATTPIVIDKHELHSTWPVYQQPESRNLSQDAVLLTVDRTQNCHGPGDRVSVHATIRSDSLSTVILRGFEFTLKETTIFRAGPHASGKKAAPQVKINIIGEQKVPVNATLYGGRTSHKVELSVTIPQTHTTTTLTSARHIDITYVLVVKALMGTGKPLIMELPVIVSNWPRYVSSEAVRRIGIAPSLSLQSAPAPVSAAQPTSPRPNTAPVNTFGGRTDGFDYGAAYGRQSSTLPNMNGHTPNVPSISTSDELGYISRPNVSPNLQPRPNTAGTEPRGRSEAEVSAIAAGVGNNTVGTGRRSSRSAVGQPNRFTIVNAVDDEIPEDEEAPAGASASQQWSRPAPTTPPSRTAWPTAEEEKARLYQQAKAEVDRVQGGLDRMSSIRSLGTASQRSNPPVPPTPEVPRWPTAEEEKVRLFNEAQNNARVLQGYADSPTQPSHGRGESYDSSRSQPHRGGQASISAGAALYSAAMSAVNRQQAASSGWQPQPTTPPASMSARPQNGPRLPTAAEEKEMLRRYHDASNAVQRHHEQYFGPGDGVMPSSSGYEGSDGGGSHYNPNLSRSLSATSAQSQYAPIPPPDDLPPPWVPNVEFQQPQQPLSEKERYRLAFEARDAAAARAGSQPPEPMGPPLDYYTATATPVPNGVSNSPTWNPTPPPGHGGLPPHVRARSPPAPPAGSSRPLTAAEEKAMLKARYDAEAAPPQPAPAPAPALAPAPAPAPGTPPSFGSHSSSGQSQAPATPPAPPPLMPRPPAEYIQQTREADLRARDQDDPDSPLEPPRMAGLDIGGDDTFGLKLRPTSPFQVGWDNMAVRTPIGANGTHGGANGAVPPPLPPKVPVNE
ncbi:hypothetical protein FA95DRAFT_1563354 [Auriscalpium vulgare]|uniref:Uncharacterized protein n=1 Tax=Auriscalpium vulgare TaxID=40419 RepID=A0ACB8RH92_9AGAM|nr:hypothetical protein FA95DRAFT_1563354 [Auriscalpium vulgare]